MVSGLFLSELLFSDTFKNHFMQSLLSRRELFSKISNVQAEESEFQTSVPWIFSLFRRAETLLHRKWSETAYLTVTQCKRSIQVIIQDLKFV